MRKIFSLSTTRRGIPSLMGNLCFFIQIKLPSKISFDLFLVDFNVLSYLVSFLIALQFKDFLEDLIDKLKF